MGRLDGKITIITDATEGLGEAQALAMSGEGAGIVCMGRTQRAVDSIVSRIRDSGGDAAGCLANVEDVDDCKQTAAFAARHYGKIDVLCNSYNLFDGFKNSLDQTEEGWDKLFSVNVLGVFHMCNAVLPYMLENSGGVILNMSAIAAQTGGAGGAAYTASRHAVAGYTKQLCVDYAARGIRANAIAAGTIMSPIVEEIFKNDPTERETIYHKIPAKRLGEPSELAAMSVFLASDEAAWIHGAIIPFDGGRSALG